MKAGRRVDHERDGLRMGGRVLTYGEVPPEGGPGRVRWCLDEGAARHTEATKAFGQVLCGLVSLVPGGLTRLPDLIDLESAMGSESRFRVGTKRAWQWRGLRRGREDLRSRLIELDLWDPVGDEAWRELGDIASRGIQNASSAYHCFRDAVLELDDLLETPTAPADAVALSKSMLARASSAHALAHRIGEVHGGLFRCAAVYRDGAWMNECPVEHLHTLMGQSAGFTAKHSCSICDAPIMACAHVRGYMYQVLVGRDAQGLCNVCRAASCAHEVGSAADVVAYARMHDAVLREVSMTARPRDPRNRIDSVEIPAAAFAPTLGRDPQATDRIWLNECMFPCAGFPRVGGEPSPARASSLWARFLSPF